MPPFRKPPVGNRGRPEGAPPPKDADMFSIESTTMRLKSAKLRRAEKEKEDADRLAAEK
jgi:hypothetical protein